MNKGQRYGYANNTCKLSVFTWFPLTDLLEALKRFPFDWSFGGTETVSGVLNDAWIIADIHCFKSYAKIMSSVLFVEVIHLANSKYLRISGLFSCERNRAHLFVWSTKPSGLRIYRRLNAWTKCDRKKKGRSRNHLNAWMCTKNGGGKSNRGRIAQ